MARIPFLCALFAAAGFAVPFEGTHVVVADDAVVYDEARQYDDAYIVARPPYWTPARCEAVGPPSSPRTYCYVTLANGTTGLAEWDYFGELFFVEYDLTLATGPGGDKAAGDVDAGEEVARVGEETTPRGEIWYEVVTADRRRGWLRAADLGAKD